MKEFNLGRLMDSCCVEISKDYYYELFDYLIDIDVDLNTLNIDDLVVNGVQYLDLDEINDDYCILKQEEDGSYVL